MLVKNAHNTYKIISVAISNLLQQKTISIGKTFTIRVFTNNLVTDKYLLALSFANRKSAYTNTSPIGKRHFFVVHSEWRLDVKVLIKTKLTNCILARSMDRFFPNRALPDSLFSNLLFINPSRRINLE